MISSMVDTLGQMLLSIFTLYIVVMYVISHLIKVILEGAIKLVIWFVRNIITLLANKLGDYIKTKKAC